MKASDTLNEINPWNYYVQSIAFPFQMQDLITSRQFSITYRPDDSMYDSPYSSHGDSNSTAGVDTIDRSSSDDIRVLYGNDVNPSIAQSKAEIVYKLIVSDLKCHPGELAGGK
jgi:hypothetical protein